MVFKVFSSKSRESTMPETSDPPSTPPPVAKAKFKSKELRPRLGEISEPDDWEGLGYEPNLGPGDRPAPGVLEAFLRKQEAEKLQQQQQAEGPQKPKGPKGNLKDAWGHLRWRWKFVIILSWIVMILLALYGILVGHFVPEASFLHGHRADKPVKGLTRRGPALQPRSFSGSVVRSSVSVVASTPVFSSSLSVATPTVTKSFPSVSATPILPTPGSTDVRVPMSFIA